MTVHSWRWVVGVAFATAGCAPAGEPPGAERVAAVRAAVLGGHVDADTTGVVGLAVDYPGYFVGHCTGTLIAPNLVLTARHCVAETTLGTADQSFSCGSAAFGPTRAAAVLLASAETIRPTTAADPAFFRGTEVRVASGASTVCGNDVAVIVLEGSGMPASVARPIVPRLDAAALPGERFADEGFGYTDPVAMSGDGTRTRADGNTVRCLGGACSVTSDVLARSEWLSANAHLCPGDSGGAALDDRGRLLGVASRAGGGCATAIYSDVAAFHDFLVASAIDAARAGGYEPPAWVTGRTSSLDGGTAAAKAPPVGKLGAECDSACGGGYVCYSSTGGPPGACVPRCGTGDACPSGYSCSVEVGACVPRPPAPSGGCSVRRGGSAGELGAAVVVLACWFARARARTRRCPERDRSRGA